MRKRGKTGVTHDDKFIAKLESSGLTVDDAAVLGMSYLTGGETSLLHTSFKPLATLRIDYFGIDGQPLRNRPQHEPFYRLRYIESDKNFSGITEAKQVRYVQEPESGVGAYFPKLINWLEVASSDQAILITEGELKAAKATKDGFATIGLGGVWNFKSTKSGITFLPELDKINWVRRNVYIVYDSDFREKEGVVLAINALAEELIERGAVPFAVTLPELSEDADAKTGLDDFLIHPSGGPEQLHALLHTAQPLMLAKPLWALNEQVVYVRSPGMLIEQRDDNKLSPAAFRDHAYSTAKYMEQEFKADGSVSLKKVPAAGAWLKWPYRREVNKLTYAPGQEKFCDDPETKLSAYNTWSGWGCEPKKGDTRPWHKLLKHLFSDADKGAFDWFLDWCAYPLQYPGTKLFSAVVVHGIYEGTGKSLIGYTLGKIYGDNFVEIRQEDLHNGKNDWAENKQFVLGDEVTGSDRRQDADTLKKLITQKKIRIDIKYVPAYSLPDCINYYFTSNHPDSFFMSDKDRRNMVIEVVLPPMDEAFYAEYDLWMHGDGPSHLFHELLHRDLSNFNPAAPAFMTKAKSRMVADTRSDLASWVRQLLADPDRILRIGQLKIERDLVTNKDLLRLYDVDGSKKLTANGLGRELRRAGVQLANNGDPISTSLGLERLYIVRNVDQWLNATTKQIQAHVDKAEGQLVKKGVRR
jgi:Family of unknown function (DUF5906)/Domain of unknown function (DUF3854)